MINPERNEGLGQLVKQDALSVDGRNIIPDNRLYRKELILKLFLYSIAPQTSQHFLDLVGSLQEDKRKIVAAAESHFVK
jgi:hypothetical protein